MSKGVNFLMKKIKLKFILVLVKLTLIKRFQLREKEESKISGTNIIIATGARSRDITSLPKDGEKIIGYRKAMVLEKQPEMIIVGSGAIELSSHIFIIHGDQSNFS